MIKQNTTTLSKPFRAARAARFFSKRTPALARYGFIGLGQMGRHMARHVYNSLEPSDKLYVNDSVPEATAGFVESVVSQNPAHKDAIFTLNSVSDFVTNVDSPLDFLITMVPEGKHVRAIADEIVRAHKQRPSENVKTVFLDSSTIDVPTSTSISELFKAELPNISFIDAPVSGGTNGADKGTLSFMLSKKSHDDISPSLNKLLNYMGKNIFACGEKHGSGLAAKLSNNYLLAVTNLAVADSFQLANAFNLNLQQYAKLVAVSTGKAWASVDNCPIPDVYPKEYNLPADKGYQGGFVTKLTKKDLVLATESAKGVHRSLFLGDIAKQWYLKACERQDLANRDLGCLFEWLGDLKEEGGMIVDQKTSEKFKL